MRKKYLNSGAYLKIKYLFKCKNLQFEANEFASSRNQILSSVIKTAGLYKLQVLED